MTYDNIIVQYTTPTITVGFDTVNVANITDSYLTFKNGETEVLSLGMLRAIVDAQSKTVSWTLTQLETKAFPLGKTVLCYCDWILNDGTRGRSDKQTYLIEETGKEEVI